jgi:hypothetical protein
VSLSLGQLLQTLHAQGRLRSLVVEALAGQLVQEQGRQAGLSVTAEELQAAADAFRRVRGLHTASAIRAWDFAARREVQVTPSPDGRRIRSVVVSAGGKIAVGSGTVFLLEADGRLVRTIDRSASPLCFSPDGGDDVARRTRHGLGRQEWGRGRCLAR